MTRECLICNKEFRFSGTKRKLTAKFCSIACRAINDKGSVPWNKGKPGYKAKPCSEERKRKIGQANAILMKGRKLSKETRLKMSRSAKKGSENPAWKGGTTPINLKIRRSGAYSLWREDVFTRDNYTCTTCGIRGGKLNADHILPFALYPEFRLEVKNGRTLCEDCHKKVTVEQHKMGIFTKAVETRFRPKLALA